MSQSAIFKYSVKNFFTNKLIGPSNYLRNAYVLRYQSSKSTKTKTASSVYGTMKIFDRNAKILQRERAAQKEDYHLAEYIKEEIGWRTADRVFDIKRTFKNAVELGAGRGYVSRHFLPDSVEKVTLCDTSQTHLDKAIIGDGVKYVKVVMDEENFEFPEDSVDLLVSSLALHWVNDLPGCFDRVMRCLKPDGVFLASVFGGGTLVELRQALQLAEAERRGGVAAHVSPFTHVQDIGGLLTAAGFTLQTVDVDALKVWFPSAWHVMRDVRALGEGNAALSRPPHLSRDLQFAAAALYDHMYGKVPARTSRSGTVAACRPPSRSLTGWGGSRTPRSPRRAPGAPARSPSRTCTDWRRSPDT
ncbi:PREDICTED: NADH dehydrogenase [ubiquinone] 1 alpha subcomplex assembly factor 5 isoform X1 [Papilio xuthus]|uniref:NADH dehydrogenase [ubiquinone] 1 alpha subcomplex assembly factor 5 isoform X1 n=1 Tax=Papilio xuthus TaxID=66420 RepID=A0AAJ6ZPB3_PAPXU|nr:PREDICTED: NADH dehydrogenase [ubiquinone] 1 alpha subcomplex assembly factor 5 isoform X1 [Papilio xuthus]